MIELMSVIAITAAVAILMYQKNTIRANRTDVQAAMVNIGQNLAAYKLANNDYNTTLLNSAIFGSTVYPQTGTALYDLRLETSSVGSWTLTAIPKSTSTQAGDHQIVLNDQGQHCWSPTTECTPSTTTGWDVGSIS